MVPAIGPCVRIVTSALNAFRPPRQEDPVAAEAEALQMLAKSEETRNPLADKMLAASRPLSLNRWSKANWTPMDAAEDLAGFPKLSLQDIRGITFGPYQIRKARDYAAEHINENGDFSFHVSKLEDGILRCRVQSRHVNATKYKLAVQYNATSVLGYCCMCTVGKRTLGCCSHIAAVIWYLGFARYQPNALKGKGIHAAKLHASIRPKPK